MFNCHVCAWYTSDTSSAVIDLVSKVMYFISTAVAAAAANVLRFNKIHFCINILAQIFQ